MNAERPSAFPLRPVRERPVLVDDVGILPQLAAVATPVAIGASVVDVAELTRWTRAWLVACQGMLHERGVIGATPPWRVPLPFAELPVLRGDPDRRRRNAAITCLERAGIATVFDDQSHLTFTERAFTPHRAALDLDWGAIVQPLNGEPAPLLVVRALAEQIMPPDALTPVTLRELSVRTGYAAKQVRVALRRLVELGLLVASETSGAAVRFAFSPVARGAGERVAPLNPPSGPAAEPRTARGPMTGGAVSAAAASAGDPTVASAVRRSGPDGESRARNVALRLTLNGVTLSLGPGLAPHVGFGPDGIPHVSFDE